MGECGCGETNAYEILNINGTKVVVEIYPGCEHCHTGVIVTLHQFPDEDIEQFWPDMPVREFKVDHGYGQVNYPILGPEELTKAFEKMSPENDDVWLWESWMEDNALALIQRALEIKLKELKDSERERMTWETKTLYVTGTARITQGTIFVNDINWRCSFCGKFNRGHPNPGIKCDGEGCGAEIRIDDDGQMTMRKQVAN